MLPQSKEGIVGATEPGVFANAPPKNMTNANMTNSTIAGAMTSGGAKNMTNANMTGGAKPHAKF